MKIDIIKNLNEFIGDCEFELVERKGVGHPDTICDAIAETASRNYTKYCIETFGKPAHHWFDKVMLIGGEANVGYGVGEITKPYTIIFAGKVSYFVEEVKIPVEEILYESVSEVLKSVLTGFLPEKHMVIMNKLVDYQGAGRTNSRYRPRNIEEMPQLGDESLVSNDCNLLSAYAPLTLLERMVLEVEQYINGSAFKKANRDTGWDVKVFGCRHQTKYDLLVNMPFLAKDIKSLEEYYSRKAQVMADVKKYLGQHYPVEVNLSMNATDKNGLPYLTALGSVADTGDVGVVGRGNRINGLITPMRPMSIEAPAGKNPIDHTGKLYGVLARQLADEIYEYVQSPVDVHIYTSKESKLDNPDEVIVKLHSDRPLEVLKGEVEKIIGNKMKHIKDISKKIVFEGIEMW